jgi:shikimate kinase
MAGTGPHVVLVGLMGTGKSTVGQLLADRWGWPLVDSDAQVEARTGRTVREIFETDGEPAFRRLEAEALAAALEGAAPSVIAAAGGVVLDPANRARLRASGTVVWLTGDPDVLAARATAPGGDHRPLLEGDPDETMRRLAAERAPLYAEVADHTVAVDTRSAAEVADAIAALVDAPEPRGVDA